MPLTVLSVSYPLAPVSLNSAGGAEQVLAMLDRGLIRCGHRSIVIAPAGSRPEGLLVPVEVPSRELDEGAKREARRRFKQVIEESLDRYPVDLLHMHGLDFTEYLPERKVPLIATLHLPWDHYRVELLRALAARVKLVAVSRCEQSSAPAGLRIHAVVENGVDLAQFHPRPRKGGYAVAIGRVCPEKGFDLAIEAARRGGIELVLAGRVFAYPEHRRYFDTQIRPRLNGGVRWLGQVGGDRKAALVAGARALLVPSLVSETSSLVAMEAMASGTPVIAWASGALGEIVDEGRTGFVVTSVDEMAERLARVDEIDPAACRAEAERRFSSIRMVEDYIAIYRLATERCEPGLRAA